MKIGIFDSGLGGLIIAKSLIQAMPQYPFVYFGDTKHVPYGSRSYETIYEFSRNCIDYLFRTQDCRLVIIACNTASIAALRKLQQEYLPINFPERRILGIIVPTLEYVAQRGLRNIGLLATEGTIRSGVYGEELAKIDPSIKVYSVAAPLLVPLVENDGDKFAPAIIHEYLEKFSGTGIDSIILGCTHYPHYKKLIKEQACEVLGCDIEVISQDEILQESLSDYLHRHPEIEQDITKNESPIFITTDITGAYLAQANRMFGRKIEILSATVQNMGS
ncbi:MAG: glutamate racemase [Alphaproteobacteria bacterium]|nr:glutamate racemase [Alphaproteobacteria bacterium]